jgi:inhibitor of KinA
MKTITTDVYAEPVIRVAGDQGILVELGDGISPQVHKRVRALNIALEAENIEGILECAQTYRSVVMRYDPLKTSLANLQEQVHRLFSHLDDFDIPEPQLVELPVCYGGEFGPDLGHVATVNDLTDAEVIARHSQPEYLIYMVGFTPGFPFLGGLHTSLHTPRLEIPRKSVPAGSVGIANGQTGVYPIESPGGWQLIGRVPITLFNPHLENPFLLSAGDLLKFTPIDVHEYEKIQATALVNG